MLEVGSLLEQMNTASGTCNLAGDLAHVCTSIPIGKENQKHSILIGGRGCMTVFSRTMLILPTFVILGSKDM